MSKVIEEKDFDLAAMLYQEIGSVGRRLRTDENLPPSVLVIADLLKFAHQMVGLGSRLQNQIKELEKQVEFERQRAETKVVEQTEAESEQSGDVDRLVRIRVLFDESRITMGDRPVLELIGQNASLICAPSQSAIEKIKERIADRGSFFVDLRLTQ